MSIEEQLRERLMFLSQENKISNYHKKSNEISEKYRNNKGGCGGILSTREEILAYAQVRMPSTFACIKKVVKGFDFSNCESLLDVGSGTGAGIFAISDCHKFKEITAVEKEIQMIAVGEQVAKDIIATKINYINKDVMEIDLDKTYDVVLASFVFNELTNDRQIKLIEKLWNVTGKYLIIIDPGKPENFTQMMELRAYMQQKGRDVCFPCMNKNECPLLGTGDWCHFIARVRRSSLQRSMKGGQNSYEDEKFTVLVFSKTSEIGAESKRVIRRPIVSKGKIVHTFCTKNGIVKETYSKSQKDIYRQAKDLDVGDKFDY